LTGAKLSFAHLEGADLTRAILVNATLTKARLDHYKDKFSKTDGCKREGGPLLGSDWHSPDEEPLRKKICKWALTHPGPGKDKEHITLPDLFKCHDGAEEAQLPAADLTNADLTEAILTEADLTGAILTGANLTEADLTGAILTGANLTEADLTGAIGMTKEQISCARSLCRTILPIRDAQEMADPECRPPATVDIRDAQKKGNPKCDPSPATGNTHECTKQCAKTHDEICALKRDDNNCNKYKDFAGKHVDIQKSCEEKSRSALCCCFRKQWDKIQAERRRSCQDDQVDAYIRCLDTHSEAIQRQEKINDLSPLIKSAEKSVSVNKLELFYGWSFINKGSHICGYRALGQPEK
jgi:hypothetical protein